MPDATESRTERVSIACTPTEKEAVRVVASIRGLDQSNLLREMRLAEIVDEARRLPKAA